MLNRKDKETFLRERGWYTWYNEDYWVHEKTVEDLKRQDPTNYGLTLNEAHEFEINKQKPFKGQFLGHMGGLKW
ncbi:MAG: hypothetical protein AABY22_17290 [Nanoarchaeota archaeon]